MVVIVRRTGLAAVVLVWAFAASLVGAARVSASGVDYAAGRPCSSSGSYASYVCGQALDGNDGTQWVSAAQGAGSWLSVTLDTARAVTHVRITQHPSSASRVAAEVWLDYYAGGVWQVSHQLTGLGIDSGVIALSSPLQTATEWRVRAGSEGPGGSVGWEVYTLQLFADGSSGSGGGSVTPAPAPSPTPVPVAPPWGGGSGGAAGGSGSTGGGAGTGTTAPPGADPFVHPQYRSVPGADDGSSGVDSDQSTSGGCVLGPLSGKGGKPFICYMAISDCDTPMVALDIVGWLSYIGCEVGNAPRFVVNGLIWLANVGIDLVIIDAGYFTGLMSELRGDMQGSAIGQLESSVKGGLSASGGGGLLPSGNIGIGDFTLTIDVASFPGASTIRGIGTAIVAAFALTYVWGMVKGQTRQEAQQTTIWGE